MIATNCLLNLPGLFCSCACDIKANQSENLEKKNILKTGASAISNITMLASLALIVPMCMWDFCIFGSIAVVGKRLNNNNIRQIN